jgi:hypothetical protein
MTGQLAWPLDRSLVPELDDLLGRRPVERSHIRIEGVARLHAYALRRMRCAHEQ